MKQLEVNDPSGAKYIIREQNGRDEDNLSRIDSDEATTINRHLATIIESGPSGRRMTLEDVEKLPLRHKYALLIKSRIFSLGSDLIFDYVWEDDDEPIEYSVDLSEYVMDYSTIPTEEVSPLTILPYSVTSPITLTLLSGAQVQFELLDGVGEKMLLGLKPNERTINKNLTARFLKIYDGSKWVLVKNFMSFSAKDMVEIRRAVEEVDPPVTGNTTLVNPRTGESRVIPILGIRDFFYPVKI